MKAHKCFPPSLSTSFMFWYDVLARATLESTYEIGMAACDSSKFLMSDFLKSEKDQRQKLSLATNCYKSRDQKRKILGTVHSNATENGGCAGVNDLGRWRISIYPAGGAFVKPGTLYKILLGGDYAESIHDKRINNDTGTSTYTADTACRIKALRIHQISYIDT